MMFIQLTQQYSYLFHVDFNCSLQASPFLHYRCLQAQTTVVLAIDFLLFPFNGISVIELASIFLRLKLCSFPFATPGYLRLTLANIVFNDSPKNLCCYIKAVNQGNTFVEGPKGGREKG